MLKTCTKCGCEKALELFPVAKRAKDGRDTRCKACAVLHAKQYAKANPEKVAAHKRAYQLRDEAGNNARVKAWHQANRDRSRTFKKRWRDANLEKARASEKASTLKNHALVLERKKIYQRANKPKWCKYATDRKAAKLRATPSWVDHDAILAVYERCAEITKLTGVKHEVDHIVPLQGELVCGLHVHYNLQPLPMVKNRSKANKLMEEYL